MIVTIIIGLLIWFAVPLLFQGKFKKNQRRALNMTCHIVGIAIVVYAVVRYLLMNAL